MTAGFVGAHIIAICRAERSSSFRPRRDQSLAKPFISMNVKRSSGLKRWDGYATPAFPFFGFFPELMMLSSQHDIPRILQRDTIPLNDTVQERFRRKKTTIIRYLYRSTG